MDSLTITIIIAVIVALKLVAPMLAKFGESKKAPQKSEWELKVKFAKLNKELYENSSEEEKEELLYYFIHKLRQKDNYGSTSFKNMAETLMVVYLVNELEAEVNNGGFLQFMTNSSGQYANETVKVLDLIGAKYTKGLLEKAIEIVLKHNTSPEQLNQKINTLKLHEIFASSDFYDNEEMMAEMNVLDKKFYEYKESPSTLKMEYFEKHKEALWAELGKNQNH